MYFLTSSKVRIENFPLSVSVHPVACARLDPGNFFGEVATIDNTTRFATVVGNGPSDIATLSLDRFVEQVGKIRHFPRADEPACLNRAFLCRADYGPLNPESHAVGDYKVDAPCQSRSNRRRLLAALFLPGQREIAGRTSTGFEIVARVPPKLQESEQMHREGRSLLWRHKKR